MHLCLFCQNWSSAVDDVLPRVAGLDRIGNGVGIRWPYVRSKLPADAKIQKQNFKILFLWYIAIL